MSETLKTYLLDTNILMTSPYAIYAFDEHNISIADVTLEELDRHKNDSGESGANAREAIRTLDSLRNAGSLLEGVRLPMGGGLFRIEVNRFRTKLPDGWDGRSPDNRILRVCKGLKEEGHSVILVSNDINMRIKADLLDIPAEEYRTEQVKHLDEQYTGRCVLLTQPGCLHKFYEKGKLGLEDIYADKDEKIELLINEFVVMHDSADPGLSALGRFDGKEIVSLKYINEKPYDITPRNAGQRFMQEAMLAPADEIPLVIIKGAAGSAKTFYSLACGLEEVVNQTHYRKILLSRPNIKFDEDIGFLKGTEEDKIAPLIRPAMDNLEQLTRVSDGKETYVEELFDRGLIEAQAMAYMRGRSITDTWIIIDEAQNMSPLQAFGMVSRVGMGSKIIIMGDPDQIDHPRLDTRTNGLVFASERMKGSPLCAQITLSGNECIRSPLALEATRRMSPKGYDNKSGMRGESVTP